MSGFDRIQRGNYLVEEPIGKADIEMRVGKFKNRKVAVKDEMINDNDKKWR